MNTPTRSPNRSGSLTPGRRVIRLLLLTAGFSHSTPLFFAANGDVYVDPRTGIRAVDKSPDDARSSGSGGQKAGNGLPPGTESIWTSIGKARAKAKEKRLEEARVANDEGVKALYLHDWKTALKFLKEAAKKNPDNPVIKKNLAYAEAELARETESIAAAEALAAKQKSEAAAKRQAELVIQQREKIAAEKMKASSGRVTQSLGAGPSAAGGPGFDGRNAGGAPGGAGNGGVAVSTSGALVTDKGTPPVSQASLDPRVVNATNLGAGLPSEVDAGITEVFSGSPAGVNERVHKGFQAVMHGDRAAAKAWFQDALNRDPVNPELQNLVTVVDSAVPVLPRATTGAARGEPALPVATAPAQANRDPLARVVPPAPTVTPPTVDPTLLQKLNEVLNRKLPPAHQLPAIAAVRG